MSDDVDKFTWNKNDVEWEFVPDPNAKPILTPDQIVAARHRLKEMRGHDRATAMPPMKSPIEQAKDQDSRHSTLRERIVEHVFVGEVLRRLWRAGITDVEVLRSEFDAGGYDLVLACRKIVRHIQFKTTKVDGKAVAVKISLKLMEKPSGCVIWTLVDDELKLDSFLWFGGAPGAPLPDIQGFRFAKHTKANAQGIKAEKPDHRILKRKCFEKLDTIEDVLAKLFGGLVEEEASV